MFKKLRQTVALISGVGTAFNHVRRIKSCAMNYMGRSGAKVLVYPVVTSEPFRMPTKANPHDAAHDLYSAEEVYIGAGKHEKIRTNLRMSIPEGWQVRVLGRSGLGSRGIQAHQGVIDHGYGQEVCVILYNHTKSAYKVAVGDRIAQIQPRRLDDFYFSYEDFSTEESRGGFGSSGVGL